MGVQDGQQMARLMLEEREMQRQSQGWKKCGKTEPSLSAGQAASINQWRIQPTRPSRVTFT